MSDMSDMSAFTITPVPFLERPATPTRVRKQRRKAQQHATDNEFIQRADHRAPSSKWPYYFVTFCFFVGVLSLIVYPLPAYREGIRFDLYRAFGSALIDGEWTGGQRELATPTFLLVSLGLTTLIGAVLFTFANVAPPIPRAGRALTISRFLKRKPYPELLNVTFGEMCYVMLVVYVNVFWFVAYTSKFAADLAEKGVTDPNDKLKKIGEAFGMNVVICMVFLGLPATRNCFWMVSLGIDYAHGIKYHRWLGYAFYAFLLAHCIPYYKAWIAQGTLSLNAFPCIGCDVGSEGRDPVQNLFGQLSLLLFTLMIVTSFGFVRRRLYEVFYYSHHLYIPAIAFACMHYGNLVMWLFPSMSLYLIHRILAFRQSSVPCDVVEFKPIPGGIVRLVFRRSLKIGGQYETAQFCYIKVPSIDAVQWHAFSISSHPEGSSDTFSVHVKTLGGWTRSLYGLAIKSESEGATPLIHVDGFYGKLTNEFERYPILILFAGGIGGTPILSILGHMFHVVKNRTNPGHCREVRFYWTSREVSIFKEFEPLLNKIRAYDPDEQVFKLRLHYRGERGKIEQVQDVPPSTFVPSKIDGQHEPRYPFHQSSRSPGRKILVFVVVFLTSALLLLIVRSNYKVLGKDRSKQNMWPLQRLVEFLTVIGGAAVGYFVATREHRPSPSMGATVKVGFSKFAFGNNNRASTLGGNEDGIALPVSTSRVDVPDILTRCADENKSDPDVSTRGIGVWVSGPMSLIHTVEVEGSAYAGLYDVHYEEFEL